jgi:DNA-binding Lrp family transcriptional regulator
LDEVDFAIYRYMFPGGEGRFWGSRPVIDPRISAREIGDLVHLSEVTVRARVAKLRSEGFIEGYDVWPSPRLFGASLRVLELTARDTHHADRILFVLGRVDGVVSARVMIDEDSRHVQVSFVEDTPERRDRCAREIVRLSDAKIAIPSVPEWIPPCSRTMTPLDWRIVAQLRRSPELGLGEHARALGVTLKTLSRRFNELLDSHAILWTMSVDNSQLSVASCTVELEDPALRDEVSQRIETRIGGWLPVARAGLGESLDPPAAWIAAVFWVRSPAATEELIRKLLKIPGVRLVRRRFPSSTINVPTWLDRRLHEQLGSGPGEREAITPDTVGAIR